MVGLTLQGQKLHGMKDDRWTSFVKVHQFKDVISLQHRDSEVTKYERDKNRRREEKLLGELRKIAKQKQDKLRNAMLGNQNRMWSTLAQHRRIQLAQGRNTPEIVIENLYQMIDYKRKQKDKYNYTKKKLMEKYKFLMLKKGEQDTLLIVQKSGLKSPLEKKMTMLCLEKQNAQMRRIAATSVRQTYIHILKILNKDAVYYESVLDCLESDSCEQSKMLLAVTEMGQIVTEYLDDITVECNSLEKGIKINMREREKSLNQYNNVLTAMEKAFKQMVRSDSELGILTDNQQDIEDSEKQLTEELADVNKILLDVQGITQTSGYEHIFPSLLIQQRQRSRLEYLAEYITNLYKQLRMASLHLEVILHLVAHTYNDDKIIYLEKKRNLLRGIRTQQKRIKKIKFKGSLNGNLLLDLRRCFGHISNMLKIVRISEDPPSDIMFPPQRDSEQELAILKIRAKRRQLAVEPVRDPLTAVAPGETSIELMEIARRRLKVVFNAFKPDSSLTKAAELFFIRAMAVTLDYVEKEKEVDLLEGLVIEDSRLPSHASVKAASAQYVKDNTVDELALVAAQVAARRKPGAFFRKLFKLEEKRRKENKCCSPY